ncbi:MAG: hypothetical protein LBV38_00210 [Alistipes sp.]|jgi:hypothetical protein|nr:hypothetical protein [Alistipes sp.]
MDASTVYTMFEEIKELLAKQLTAMLEMKSTSGIEPSATSTPALGSEDGKKIETLTDKLDTVSEQLARPLRHHHTLDFMGNRALIALVVATTAFLVSLWVIDHQRRTIAQFRDNDLKYRYIQMRGEASPADILQLSNVFDFNRNPDSIKIIRRQVEQYEKLVQQQAENEARARLNASEAERLNSEAEEVKKK